MSSLSQIPGIGPKTEEKLHKLKIFTPTDLLFHFPSRYLDFSQIKLIKNLIVDESATIKGQIIYFQNIYTRNHTNIQKAVVKDQSGTISLLWFNQPYLSTVIKKGDTLAFAGTISEYQGKKTLIAPFFGNYQTGKIIAIYPETKNLSSNWFRKIISQNINNLLSDVTDYLPSDLISKSKLLPLVLSLKNIHLPQNQEILTQARHRLALDEILSLLAQSWIQKQYHQKFSVKKKFKSSPLINQFIKKLPYKLTTSQKKVWTEIKSDLLSSTPANRLLQGDVGSGKTIIALLACLLAHCNQVTSLVVAPTEILAQQHFLTFSKLLNCPVKLLTAKTKISAYSPGTIIIATHAALFQKKKLEKSIGLLIVDEQHKFGVTQRGFLSKSISPPHTITMSATPIPRTISLTLMGNLDISQITQLPQNRKPIKTFLVPQNKTNDCYLWLKKHILTSGQQAFIVCPFIEPSETLISVKSAKKEYEFLQTKIFPTLKLGLIHGKTPSSDRQKILSDFQKNKINILITTPIIEVGIDFPNSTSIIIQSADRFGLAQLHQLRGRVGRGTQISYCYLFTESVNIKPLKRLNFLTTNSDGQKIAEFDLKTRGPGEIFSTLQHGFPSLKLASFSDTLLISTAQILFKNLITNYPGFDLNQLVISNKTTEVLN